MEIPRTVSRQKTWQAILRNYVEKVGEVMKKDGEEQQKGLQEKEDQR